MQENEHGFPDPGRMFPTSDGHPPPPHHTPPSDQPPSRPIHIPVTPPVFGQKEEGKIQGVRRCPIHTRHISRRAAHVHSRDSPIPPWEPSRRRTSPQSRPPPRAGATRRTRISWSLESAARRREEWTPWRRRCARCWWGSARTTAGRGCAGRPSASPRPSATEPESVTSYEYLMDGITFLHDVKNLVLSFVYGAAHAFGATVFHLLRLCAGIRRLELIICREEPSECPLDCTCDQQNGWKSEGIFLNLLGEAEIHGIKGVEHEVVFLKQLFRWATALEKITITFDPSVAVSDNLCEKIASFSRSETCVEIYLYRNGRKVLFAPVV